MPSQCILIASRSARVRLARALSVVALSGGLLVLVPDAAPAAPTSAPVAAAPAPAADRTTPQDDQVVHPEVTAALERQHRGAAPTVRVIVSLDVTGKVPQPAAVRAARVAVLDALPTSSYDVVSRFDRIAAVSLEVDATALDALESDPLVTAVSLDHVVRLEMTQALAITNADDVHTSGITGAGTQVAVIDSGVDSDHPGLVDDLVAQQCFRTENDCPGGSGSAEDQNGHGTHVAGIVTGPNGAAPDAQFRALKVFTTGDTSDTNILNALNHVIGLNTTTPGTVDLVNMSLGGGGFSSQSACDSANPGYVSAFASLNNQGTTVFVATGNNAFIDKVSSPACVSGAVGVGSTGDGVHNYSFGSCFDQGQVDKVSCFSNATPVQGPGELVDLLAPGCDITSTWLAGGTLTICGTSMASPLATAVGALVLEKAADVGDTVSPASLETILEQTGAPLTDYRIPAGPTYPRVDALAAVQALPLDPPPANDELADAETVAPGASGSSQTDTETAVASATEEPGDPPFSCRFNGPDTGFQGIWYRIQPTSPTEVTIDTAASTLVVPISNAPDTLLAVYEGTPSSATEIACNDDIDVDADNFLSQVTVDLDAGGDYFVHVAQWGPVPPGTSGTVATQFSWEPIPLRPDARIKKGLTGTLVGNDIYGTATGQTRTAKVARGKTVTFVASLQNDAAATDVLDVLGGAGNSAMKVTYKTPAGLNVTSQVVAGTFETPALATGAVFDLTVVVKVKSTAPAGASITRTVRATSEGDPGVSDAVTFKVTRK